MNRGPAAHYSGYKSDALLPELAGRGMGLGWCNALWVRQPTCFVSTDVGGCHECGVGGRRPDGHDSTTTSVYHSTIWVCRHGAWKILHGHGSFSVSESDE